MGFGINFEEEAEKDAKRTTAYIDHLRNEKKTLEAKVLQFHTELSNLNTDHSLDNLIKLHTDTFGISNDRIQPNYIPDLD